MATFIKGNAVANATSYELLEKTGNSYVSHATANEINFEVSALGLSAGNHTLVVKAKADGYEDSDYSNEVVYSVESEDDILSGITMVFGNAFLATPNTDKNRASSSINFRADGRKNVSLKDPTKYDYALYTCTDETTQAGGVGSGWIEYANAYTNQWIGVCLRKKDESDFDFSTESNLLSDYITVE